jgi:glucosamine 6-phosphate synthetase-like amidotransferase/phosphosugar isomerase protein
VAQNLEEWAHLQFFFTRPDGIPIFVLVPPGFSRDRAIEQIRGMQNLGGTVIAICSHADAEIQELVTDTLLIQGDLPEDYTPWVYGVTGQLLAITLMDLKGQPPIPPPYSFKQMMQVNFNQIYASQIDPELEG